MTGLERLRAYQKMEAARPDAAPTWKADLAAIVRLVEEVQDAMPLVEGMGLYPGPLKDALGYFTENRSV